MIKTDIIIVGSGIVGLVLAQALARQSNLSICILESQTKLPSWSQANYHHRVSAISLASQRIFQNIGIWDDIKSKRISPFKDIHVWDGIGKGEIHFCSQDIGESALGFIIENNAMHASLLTTLDQYPQINMRTGVSLASLTIADNKCLGVLQDGEVIEAKLVIGADGANSWLRHHMKIDGVFTNYHEQALVAMVETALPHQQVARQVFLPTGPLAFLPLQQSNLSSIVWSLPKEKAIELLEVEKIIFEKELSTVFTRLGAIIHSDTRFTFPLSTQHCYHYVSDRLALIGDAAHTIHPLAGQGLNLGLQDAITLGRVVSEAALCKRDFGSHYILRKYERKQRAQNALMLQGVDGLKSLFANNKTSIQIIRSLGLNWIDQTPWAKNIFTRYASQGA